ncbi:MAG: type II toxin-antitoxin system RelE/ParE family toxin [Chloroflexi bacterium]|nr:type II toxin-antitoxin system RelE/ParE family toxin [Chloroflexota bacterium]
MNDAREPRYRLQVPKRVLKTLQRQPQPTRQRLKTAIFSLQDDPFPPGDRHKRLAGTDPPVERLRVGDYRVLYEVTEDEVWVIDIVHRRDLKRWVRTRA